MYFCVCLCLCPYLFLCTSLSLYVCISLAHMRIFFQLFSTKNTIKYYKIRIIEALKQLLIGEKKIKIEWKLWQNTKFSSIFWTYLSTVLSCIVVLFFLDVPIVPLCSTVVILLLYLFSDPYHWAWLQYAKIPFSETIRELVLPQLSDMNFVQGLIDDLFELFSVSLDWFSYSF